MVFKVKIVDFVSVQIMFENSQTLFKKTWSKCIHKNYHINNQSGIDNTNSQITPINSTSTLWSTTYINKINSGNYKYKEYAMMTQSYKNV